MKKSLQLPSGFFIGIGLINAVPEIIVAAVIANKHTEKTTSIAVQLAIYPIELQIYFGRLKK